MENDMITGLCRHHAQGSSPRFLALFWYRIPCIDLTIILESTK